jgi:hypothetical protein
MRLAVSIETTISRSSSLVWTFCMPAPKNGMGSVGTLETGSALSSHATVIISGASAEETAVETDEMS